MVSAITTNGARNPHPITVEEGARIRRQAYADLERIDPDLWRAVKENDWDDSVAWVSSLERSYAEWSERACRQAKRWNKIREALRRSRSTRIGGFRYTERSGRRIFSPLRKWRNGRRASLRS